MGRKCAKIRCPEIEGNRCIHRRCSVLAALSDKNADIHQIASQAIADSSLLRDILEGLNLKVSTKSHEETIRYNCFKTLMQIAASTPELLYPEWNRFESMLDSQNSYDKMAAVHLIAGLIEADADKRFEKAFDNYFGLLDDKSMIVAVYVASNAGRIVKAKSHLEPLITERLLGIEKTHHTPSRMALVVAGAIESFELYLDAMSSKERVGEFVERQRQSISPKTRKLANGFLKRFKAGSC